MADTPATTESQLNVLSIDLSDEGRGQVHVQVDGRTIDKSGSMKGFSPAEVFESDLPLLPTHPPRRVALLGCSCGIPACESIAPIIEYGGTDEQLIVWSDFRHFTGDFDGPTTDHDPQGGRRAMMPTYIFDRMEYEAEVFRAAADRSWESLEALTARLLRGMLSTDGARLRAAALVAGWVSFRKQDARWLLEFNTPRIHRTEAQTWADRHAERAAVRAAIANSMYPTDPVERMGFRALPEQLRPWEVSSEQTVLALTTGPGDPPSQAADLYRQLWAVPIAEWKSTFRWRPDFGHHEPDGASADEPDDG